MEKERKPPIFTKKNQMTIFDYAKLKAPEKERIIQETAVLLESYIEGTTRVTVYYMPSFFIEVNTCLIKNKMIDIIPYRRGHKIEKQKDQLYKVIHNKYILVA